MLKNQSTKVPMGVKIICICLSLVFIFHFLFLAFCVRAQNLSQETKLKLIQTEEYRKRNITTVQQFDAFYRNGSSKVPITKRRIISIIVAAILICGLLYLQNWARWGMIILSIWRLFDCILRFSTWTASFTGFVSTLLTFALFASIIIYLTRPNVSKLFK